MAGRGRGRGFGRGQSFANKDPLNSLTAEKVPSAPLSPYPPLEFYPAPLSSEKEYDDLLQIRDELLADFQSSDFHFKQEDANSKLFSSGGEKVATGNCALDFNWDFFPLELRPLYKQRQKKIEVEKQRKSAATNPVDLSWLDSLEKKENELGDVAAEDGDAAEANEEEGADAEELPEEDPEMDSDYLNTYFDSGDVDPDDNLDEDEDPTY